jgi:formamidopyrimidine-DNA glycosylase
MPELPEVETVARQLEPRLVGTSVVRFQVLDPLLASGPLPRIAGRTVLHVGRSGKQVLIGFSPLSPGDGALWLAVHLRMTGRLIWADPGARTARRHLRARFRLDRGRLLFYDTRRFGTMRWAPSAEHVRPAGLDPLSPALGGRRLRRLLAGSTQPLKSWLLRQDRLVGLGNIYASEILHAAGLSPWRAAGTLDGREIERLLRSTRAVLRKAIRNCGTTFSDFQDADGLTGSYQRYLEVYGREGQPCPRCGAEVARAVQQQRSTFYCPGCQR